MRSFHRAVAGLGVALLVSSCVSQPTQPGAAGLGHATARYGLLRAIEDCPTTCTAAAARGGYDLLNGTGNPNGSFEFNVVDRPEGDLGTVRITHEGNDFPGALARVIVFDDAGDTIVLITGELIVDTDNPDFEIRHNISDESYRIRIIFGAPTPDIVYQGEINTASEYQALVTGQCRVFTPEELLLLLRGTQS